MGVSLSLPRTFSGALPSVASIFAPINSSGSIIRRIGRELNDVSPISSAQRSCPAKTPVSILSVEPLFPQSSGSVAATSFLLPEKISLPPLCSIETPSCRRQERVEAQSWAVEKFKISDLPEASAAIRAARCEIDLSPGMRRLPEIKCAGASLILFRLCALKDISTLIVV